jgi:hypothetical protein
MMVSSNSTVACSPFVELRNEFDWYEHSFYYPKQIIQGKNYLELDPENMISLQEPAVLLMCCKMLMK